MKRKDFLINLGLGAVGLTSLSFGEAINRKQVKIYDNYLRGVFACDYSKVKFVLKKGDTVRLVREPNNNYDRFAIAVYYNKTMLGYIAAYENIVLANMLDSNVNLNAVINYLHLQEESNKSVAVQVFCDLVSPTPLLIKELEKRADDEVDIYRKRY